MQGHIIKRVALDGYALHSAENQDVLPFVKFLWVQRYQGKRRVIKQPRYPCFLQLMNASKVYRRTVFLENFKRLVCKRG